MNGPFQCLLNINLLTNYFLENREKFSELSNEMELSRAYSEVIYNLWDESNRNGVFHPFHFKEIISKENKMFEGNSPNDSKDLILFLYERLHKELNEKNKKKIIIEKIDSSQSEPEIEYFKCVDEFGSKNKSIISDLFYYNQANITECLSCGQLK